MKARATLIALLTAAALACEDSIPTAPTPDTALLQREFSSALIPGGSASRDFEMTTAGTIAVTLKTTTPPGVVIGVGIGIPRANGSCAASAGVETVAGDAAQISVTAQAGSYCAKVYDPGTLPAPVPFTISISRP